VKLTIIDIDGAEKSYDVADRLWMCMADRLAFETRFGITSQQVREMSADERPETWYAFFAWRAACREDAEIAADFDVFAQSVVAVRSEFFDADGNEIVFDAEGNASVVDDTGEQLPVDLEDVTENPSAPVLQPS